MVRISAGQVRKRLAQYYQEATDQDLLRIELPAGYYRPEFVTAIPRLPLPSQSPSESALPLAGEGLAVSESRGRSRPGLAAILASLAVVTV